MSREFHITTLEELKNASFPISKPIRTFFPIEGSVSDVPTYLFNPTYDLEEAHHCFREVWGVIAFIDEEEVLYAIPACDLVRRILEENSFIPDSYLKVPFIFMEFPVENMERWSDLLEWGYEKKKNEFFAV